jgi:hypothetical protein
MDIENDLDSKVFFVLKACSDGMPSTKKGHLAGISEGDLMVALAVGGTRATKDDVLKAVISLSKTGKIYLDDSDGGVPNYERGGANYHYRYHILADMDGVASSIPSHEYWITKDSKSGSYFFDGKKVLIKNKMSDYARIFDAVFSLTPQGGEVSYEAIIKQCNARHFSTNRKAIQKALTGKDANFFRYVKDVPSCVEYGTLLFFAKSNGSALDFKNKR